MAAAVHHHHLLRLLSPPPPRPPGRLLFRPAPPHPLPVRLRSSLPAPSCHLGAVADQHFVDDEFVVVTFYKLVPVEDPRAEVTKHLHFLQGRDIHGRIYMNEQGINAQYSGPRKDAMAYADWLRRDHRFSDIHVQVSPALCGHAFPRLKLRYKPSLVQLEGGSCHLPLVESSMRASPLTPSEWREKLEARKRLESEPAGDTSGRNVLLLDVRNGYEWDIGHFEGAKRPNVDCFRSTSFGLSEQEVYMPDFSYDLSRKKGFGNLYTLKGGVSNYLTVKDVRVGGQSVSVGRPTVPATGEVCRRR